MFPGWQESAGEFSESRAEAEPDRFATYHLYLIPTMTVASS